MNPGLASTSSSQDDLLWTLTDSTAGLTGVDFLAALAEQLATTLGMDLTAIVQTLGQPPEKGRVIAAWRSGISVPSYEFDLSPMPCRLTLKGEEFLVPCHLQELFPEGNYGYQSYVGIALTGADGSPIGHIAVFDKDPFDDGDRRAAIVRLFARRAEAELRRMGVEEDLRRIASIDPLTNLKNRRAFFADGDMEFARARRHGRPMAVLLIDADRFKFVNDTFGHAVGDRALVLLANTIVQSCRGYDRKGRLGGEEFAVLLPDTNLDGAMVIAERTHATLRRMPLETGTCPHILTVSIGVAELLPTDGGLADMMNRADQGLYRAKAEGRNRTAAVRTDRLAGAMGA